MIFFKSLIYSLFITHYSLFINLYISGSIERMLTEFLLVHPFNKLFLWFKIFMTVSR